MAICVVCSVLSFFPVAFLLVQKGQGIFPTHATTMKRTDKKLTLNLSFANHDLVEFPFIVLKGNQMYSCRESMCITSYPIVN